MFAWTNGDSGDEVQSEQKDFAPDQIVEQIMETYRDMMEKHVREVHGLMRAWSDAYVVGNSVTGDVNKTLPDCNAQKLAEPWPRGLEDPGCKPAAEEETEEAWSEKLAESTCKPVTKELSETPWATPLAKPPELDSASSGSIFNDVLRERTIDLPGYSQAFQPFSRGPANIQPYTPDVDGALYDLKAPAVGSNSHSAEKIAEEHHHMKHRKPHGRSLSHIWSTHHKNRAADYISDRKRTELIQQGSWLSRFTSHKYYETASCMLVLANSVAVGVESQYMSIQVVEAVKHDPVVHPTEPVEFFLLSTAFTAIFSLDLILRWIGSGLCEFWFSRDKWWNVLDFVVVGTGIMDFTLEVIAAGSGLANLTALRVLRLIRIVRVARIIRVFRFFKDLRLMATSILGSMVSLIWVILVIALMLYVFGIIFTGSVSSFMITASGTELNEDLILWFGRLDTSVISLFMAMTGGQDWSVFFLLLQEVSVILCVVFIFFIVLSMFAVVNVVTAIFVENAKNSSSADRAYLVQHEMDEAKDMLHRLEQLFEEMDEDDTGILTRDEFDRQLQDDRIVAYFHAMKLNVSDARVMFELLDRDHSSGVSVQEFLSGCHDLMGEATSLDSKIMHMEVRMLRESVGAIGAAVVNVLQGKRSESVFSQWSESGCLKPELKHI